MNKTSVNQQAKTASFLPPAQGILQRQCACGNHTVAGGQCAECEKKKNVLQRKLTIGASDDPLEQEADRIADQVMAIPSHSVVSGAPRIQRYTGQASEGENTAPASVDRVLTSSGRPLEPALQQDMGQRFGHDFSQVQVHTGGAAEQSARGVNAHAYTVANNVVFGASQFSPSTHEGRRLIAHELTHVVQQRNVVQPYRKKTKFNFGKLDDKTLIEDSFNEKKDKETKPWIKLVNIEFSSKKTDSNGNNYWSGTANAQYYDNTVKLADFSFPVAGGSAELGKTDKGNFTVHRIEGVGYNSGSNSGSAGVDYDISNREGPKKRYSKDLNANMSYAVFYNGGEALHFGSLDDSSHGCVHVDWAYIQKLNYHSVEKLTQVSVKYS